MEIGSVVDPTWRDPALSAASPAGLVNNLNEAMAWGLAESHPRPQRRPTATAF